MITVLEYSVVTGADINSVMMGYELNYHYVQLIRNLWSIKTRLDRAPSGIAFSFSTGAIKLFVWAQVVFGIFILSSAMFISLWSPLTFIGRYLRGSLACRLVLAFNCTEYKRCPGHPSSCRHMCGLIRSTGHYIYGFPHL
jgi:hypothetical protein